ncbi:MAG: hypothetical protein BWY04_00630 [candidate division CPR1 bacterium ADurb.Bin160]|jgi:hypothetical protein|uniref:Uncharacterized protein n=1 Tax=candidate division CPR1 bacterium ADurb.Bin160 TaxID=1852826 RepID=A0A1V5ZNZ9_9BACT|nr:MAG: hypothetical protein BWY04_00630 [candidate division CPR1 bacterium ADurb.Bin160]
MVKLSKPQYKKMLDHISYENLLKKYILKYDLYLVTQKLLKYYSKYYVAMAPAKQD